MPSDRTPVLVRPHMEAVLATLQTIPSSEFPCAYWERPKNGQMVFEDPPYALTRNYPSAGDFDGPLSDSQVDVIYRVQVLAVGKSEMEVWDVSDRTRQVMVASILEPFLRTFATRALMDLNLMVSSGGISRDDDLPSPFFYDTDLYELRTTPV